MSVVATSSGHDSRMATTHAIFSLARRYRNRSSLRTELMGEASHRLCAFEQLKRTRGWRMQLDCGDYYILNFNRNFVVDHHVDVEALARELGWMQTWETVRET
jgi:hypothetical protein